MRETLLISMETLFHLNFEYVCWKCTRKYGNRFPWSLEYEFSDISAMPGWDYRPASPRLVFRGDNKWRWQISTELVGGREPGESETDRNLSLALIQRSHGKNLLIFRLIENVMCSPEFLAGNLSEESTERLLIDHRHKSQTGKEFQETHGLRLHNTLFTESYHFLLAPHESPLGGSSRSDQLSTKRICEQAVNLIFPTSRPWFEFIWQRIFLGDAIRLSKSGEYSLEEEVCDECFCKILVAVNAIGLQEVVSVYTLLRVIAEAVTEVTSSESAEQGRVSEILDKITDKYKTTKNIYEQISQHVAPLLTIGGKNFMGTASYQTDICVYENAIPVKMTSEKIESLRKTGSTEYALIVDCITRKVWFFEIEVPITGVGFDLLHFLAGWPPGQVHKYEDILKTLLKGTPDANDPRPMRDRIQKILYRGIWQEHDDLRKHIIIDPPGIGLRITEGTRVLVIENSVNS